MEVTVYRNVNRKFETKLQSATPKKLLGRLVLASVLALTTGHAHAEGGSVSIHVELNPVGDFNSKSTAVRGKAKKEGDAYVAKKLLLDLDTLKSGVELRDNHMAENYFETKKDKFNKWAMISDAKGKDGKFTANLMIRKVKKPVEGTYEVSGKKLTAKFKTKMTDYKIKKASYMGVGANDQVEVEAEIPIE